MFEPTCEFPVKTGAAFLSKNLSVFNHKAKGMTYAAYLGTDAVQLVSWNEKLEQSSCELIGEGEIVQNAGHSAQKPISLMQVNVCLPNGRNSPVLVLLATTFVSLIDFKTRKHLWKEPTGEILCCSTEGGKRTLKATTFSKGISCVENLIVAGCNSGEIVQIVCSDRDGSFQSKKSLKVPPTDPNSDIEPSKYHPPIKEHSQPVTDIATCMFDQITVSGDVVGNVVVWAKNMKVVQKRINTNIGWTSASFYERFSRMFSTVRFPQKSRIIHLSEGQQLSVLNVLRKQVFCGNLLGQICVYSTQNGALLAELNAHSRQITSLEVATESAYIMSASEDTYVRIWKLHSRNPEAYKVEFRYSQRFENMPIIGAAFSNTRGSGYLITFYENVKLLHFKITRRASPNPTTQQEKEEGGSGEAKAGEEAPKLG